MFDEKADIIMKETLHISDGPGKEYRVPGQKVEAMGAISGCVCSY